MNEHPHNHDAPQAPVPLMPDDAGSRALADALRGSFLIVRVIMVLLVVLFFGSGFFTVGPQERAVILRFGKPVGLGEAALLGPGPHWSWPPPIDERVRIPFTQVQVASSTAAWYATTPELEAARNEPPPRETLNPAADGYVITADANIIHVRAGLRYRITDPIQFIFAFRDAPDFVTNALNNALFFAAAQFKVDDALTRNVTAFSERIAARVNQLAEQQRLGIAVEQMAITSVIPPRQLTDSFRAVLDASVRRDRQLNEALTHANEVVSRAGGEAASRVAMAQSDRARLVETVAAEAQRFTELLPKYRENPELFMRLRQADTFQRVLTNAEEKIFLNTRADGRPVELRLQLSRELQKPKPTPPAPMEDRH